MKKLLVILFVTLSSLSFSQVVNDWVGARMLGSKVLDNGNTVQIWGYGMYSPGLWGISVPGPVLEYIKGDTVLLTFVNDSPEDHTIHLHGLDVPTPQDGVPATSFAVGSMDTAYYSFVAHDEGMFLYHCHVLTTLHLTMGMYGAIVVHPDTNENTVFQGGPSYTNDYNFLNSDMDESVNDNPLSPGPFNEFQMDYFMVNGLSGNQLYTSTSNHVTAFVGDSVLLRIGSMAYSKSIYYFPPELNAVAYTSDGRVLPNSFDCDTLVVHSGERYGVLLTPTANVDTDIRVESVEMRTNTVQSTNLIKLNTSIGFEEKEANLDLIYPNPSNGQLYFVTENPGSDLEIYTINGGLMSKNPINSNQEFIDFSDLENGSYIFKYLDETYKVVLIK